MKTLIIYRSVLGSSKNYALWLGNSIRAKVVRFNQVRNEEIGNYEQIILVGGTYAGWVSLDGFIREKWSVLRGKKLILANVGMAGEKSEETKESWDKLHPEFREKAKMYKIPGKIGRLNEENVEKSKLGKIIKEAKKQS